MAVKVTKKAITLENKTVKLELSRSDATLLSVVTADGVDITGERKSFFALTDESWQEFKILSLDFENDTFFLKTEKGEVKIGVTVRDNFFIFEVLTALPEGVYCIYMGNASYEYDPDDEDGPRAVGVAMTVSVDPVLFPDGYDKRTLSKTYEHLEGAKGARYGYAVISEKSRRAVLQEICSEIDPEKGIVMKSAGPWAFENERVQGSYMLSWFASQEYLDDQIDALEYLGIDHLDIVQNNINTFRQGDFEYMLYDGHEDFKARVTDRLAKHGIQTGFHTYGQYIDPKCHGLLSDPKWQKQLSTLEEFTLSENISAEADFVPTVESTAELSDYYGFFSTNMPYVLIDEEIIKYKNAPNGFTVTERGACGTTPAEHKKDAVIYHIDGCFYFFAPKHGSELFLKIARQTAENYNRGGYTMIYLDAVDGTRRHCRIEERPYYIAKFTHEVIKNCHDDPIIEFADMPPSVWASRSRMGAWDIPFRGLKNFCRIHHKYNKAATRHLYNSTLGWVSLYPITDKYPGNQHTKYFHTDAIEFMGTLAILYNYSNAYSNYNLKIPGWKRNLDIYKFYDKLRRDRYFSEEILEKARQNPHELAVADKGHGKYALVEKNYDIKRYYGINEESRNTLTYENPFKKQTPFVRIEHCMSTLGRDPMLLLPMNEEQEVTEQLRLHELGSEINLINNLAMTVRVKGNGKKGTVALRLKGGTNSENGYGLYLIDTDFEGWRDFVLLEADNGDRPELFEEGLHMYPVYRSGLNMDRISSIELLATGDVEGVRMSSVNACRQVYNVLKNPTVTVGKETVMFECELMSTDFIEWDGKTAKVIDRYANEKPIWFQGSLTVPKGKYRVTVGYQSSLNNCPVNLYLTMGTTGKEIK
ncbi:MAG: hypothetical protein IJP16_04095 [Clostridia bacterium]|nr:hypothetical protein [Clostridia bacterium]